MPEIRLPRSLEGLAEMFDFLDDHLEACDLDEGTVFDLRLAAEELFTNMVRHNVPRAGGGGDPIAFVLERTGDRIELRLTDYGVGPFDAVPAGAVDGDGGLADRQPGGIGVLLVKKKFDRVHYEHKDGNLHVSVSKKLGEENG